MSPTPTTAPDKEDDKAATASAPTAATAPVRTTAPAATSAPATTRKTVVTTEVVKEKGTNKPFVPKPGHPNFGRAEAATDPNREYATEPAPRNYSAKKDTMKDHGTPDPLKAKITGTKDNFGNIVDAESNLRAGGDPDGEIVGDVAVGNSQTQPKN